MKFPTRHHGYSVIKEELDELWHNVKGDRPWKDLAEEAAHVGAMALRFLIDLKDSNAS